MAITRPAQLPARLTTPLFNDFERIIQQEHPDAVVLPTMLAGAADSAQLRAAGVPTCGFGSGTC
jgi:hypothetical protein